MAIEITDIRDPRVAAYSTLTEAQLRNRLDPEAGIMIVESPKVIRTALAAGCQPVSLLCEQRHLTGDAKDITEQLAGVPIYTGSREVLARLTGYTLTRGVLCAMRRPSVNDAAGLCAKSRRLAVIADVCDTTNIGSIFRSAAALGIDGVAVTRSSCDPFNRRSIRVSMGTVFQIPWCIVDDPSELRRYGFKTAALALRTDSVEISDPRLKAEPKLAMILGTEGNGLPDNVIREADYTVLIPMHNGVDSLNVGAAAAIAFYELNSNQAFRP